tara:strand:+ start:153 stop:1976 length:1824 start_codon:yes stop_codon:yes gene_type:complete
MAVPIDGVLTLEGLAQEALYGTYGSGTITPPIHLYDLVNGGDSAGSGNSYPTVNEDCLPNPASRLPVITTKPVSNVTSNSAQTGGTGIVSTSPITSKGIEYSTSSTFATKTTITSGSGTADFNISIAGLNATTQYYVRAFAVNILGTGYGATDPFFTGVRTLVVTTQTFGFISYPTIQNPSVYDQDITYTYTFVGQTGGYDSTISYGGVARSAGYTTPAISGNINSVIFPPTNTFTITGGGNNTITFKYTLLTAAIDTVPASPSNSVTVTRSGEFYTNPNWTLADLDNQTKTEIPVYGTGSGSAYNYTRYGTNYLLGHVSGCFFNSTGTKFIVVMTRFNDTDGSTSISNVVTFIEYNLSAAYNISSPTFVAVESITIPLPTTSQYINTAQLTSAISKDNTKIYLTVSVEAGAPYLTGTVKTRIMEYELTNECSLPVTGTSQSTDLIYVRGTTDWKATYLYTSKFSNYNYVGSKLSGVNYYQLSDTSSLFSYIPSQTGYSSLTGEPSGFVLKGTLGGNDEFLLSAGVIGSNVPFYQYKKTNNALTSISNRRLQITYQAFNGTVTNDLRIIAQTSKQNQMFLIHDRQEYNAYVGYHTYSFFLVKYDTNF